jgi:hypothetical protein
MKIRTIREFFQEFACSMAGKDVAKSNRDKNKWFNQIDFYTRNLKDQETHGLLIGPHASNLLSEIILVNIVHCTNNRL